MIRPEMNENFFESYKEQLISKIVSFQSDLNSYIDPRKRCSLTEKRQKEIC